MKKLLLIGLLTLLAVMISAQTGLFELTYGVPAEESIAILEVQGFELVDSNGDSAMLQDTTNEYVDHIQLIFREGFLVAWYIAYLPQEEEDIEYIVVEALELWHGYDYTWDEDMELYVWELEDSRKIEAIWDWNYEFFWVGYLSGD